MSPYVLEANVVRIDRFTLLILMLLAVYPVGSSPLEAGAPVWVRDAVHTLAAEGLIAGYPGAGFRGDRALTRWEAAAFLAKVSARDLEHLADRKLLTVVEELESELRSELTALGGRFETLRTEIERLETRTDTLERTRFYGSLEARYIFSSFKNDGAPDNDSGRGGEGLPGPVGFLPYDQLVGTSDGPPLRPQIHGVIPVVDYRQGRALLSGTGLTSSARLGLEFQLHEDLSGGLEVVGFASQGDPYIGAYWGVTPPYSTNPLVADASFGQASSSSPITRAVFDRFWLKHEPSRSVFTYGNLTETRLSSFVYAGIPNLGAHGPRRFPGFGAQYRGEAELGTEGLLSWEAFFTRVGDGTRFQGLGYRNQVMGAHLEYRQPHFGLAVDYARVFEEAADGGRPLEVGLIQGPNVAAGASPGWSARQWVNPPGYYLGQLPQPLSPELGTIPNEVDPRPIPGWSGTFDSAAGVAPGGGNYGPQQQSTLGLSSDLVLYSSEDHTVQLDLEAGWSRYRPNRRSPFESHGRMLRAALQADLFQKRLLLSVEQLSVDANYNPTSWGGNLLGIRFPMSFNFTGLFHLHDFARYPHNRTGQRAKVEHRFSEGAGRLWLRGALLDQTETSLYDVRVPASSLGSGLPNSSVLGFSPGFVDPIFSGLAHPIIYGARSGSSFTADLTPLENPRGRTREFEVGASYRFQDLGLELSLGYESYRFYRPTELTPALGGSQNFVDVSSDLLTGGLEYRLSPSVTLRGSLDRIRSRGHHDPGGLYNGYALASGRTDFRNLWSEQLVPGFGFDWALTDSTTFGLDLRTYTTKDRTPQGIQPGGPTRVGASAHPFSWSGTVLSTHWKTVF